MATQPWAGGPSASPYGAAPPAPVPLQPTGPGLMPAPMPRGGKPVAAILSLVFGLLPVPFWIAALVIHEDIAGLAFLVTIAAGVVAIVTGAVGISQAKSAHLAVGGMGMAIAGLTLGILGVLTGVVALIVVIIVFATCMAALASCCGSGAGAAAVVGSAAHGRPPRGWRAWLAHHADDDRFHAHVFHVGGVALCVGCFTAVPVFAVVMLLLQLTGPVPPGIALGAGFALASAQLVSTFGRARRRRTKVLVKACLGAGLALAASGFLALPLGQAAQMLLALAFVAAGWVSTLPRARRRAVGLA